MAFFESLIGPLFAHRRAIVAVLPAIKAVRQVSGSYDVHATRLARRS